uniref:Protein RFT1 homolog n=1 Tax=Heterorhabditis bacteriophora TaxID=37862 RepID=A0A1I7WCD2_HETBA
MEDASMALRRSPIPHLYSHFLNQGVCICDGASLSDRYAMLLRISICAMVEAGTISLFGYVLILSRSEADGLGINTAKYSLSKRFQIYETYRTTQMLLPSAVLHAVMYLSYLCLLIPVRDLRCHALSYVVTFNSRTNFDCNPV